MIDDIKEKIFNYTDDIGEAREDLVFQLGTSRIRACLHPFKTIKNKMKLKKIEQIDREFSDLLASQNVSNEELSDYMLKHRIR